MDLIDRAVEYAREKHKDQKRKDGSPYIIHPLAVAEIVAEMGLDMDAVLGALLHDCIEDTDASFDEIARLFGRTTAELVEGVTKLTRANFSSTEEAQMENLRKMFMAMSKDIRVVLIKIADRLHNMRTLDSQSPEKQRIKAMSKGTKEKLQLILTMSRDAKLYLLDEPIGGVDPATRDYILRTIINNYNPDASVIISTHLISDVEQVLDEVLFLRYGNIMLHDSVDNIRNEKGTSIDALFREVFRC